MASDKSKNGEEPKEKKEEEGGLGNLPPLSDFDAGASFASDSGLPPMGSFESGKDQKDSIGGLPPIGDLHVETPVPTGGNIKPPPPGFEPDQFETPSFSTPSKKSKGGFQDLAADSDFSPETPEIGPGPDMDVDTPMFDSAFGGGGSFTPAFETPAPTQAMETPMFGGPAKPAADQSPFDEGAFSPGGFDAGGRGTPMPDFSPDTAFPAAQAAPAKAPAGAAKQKPPKAAKIGGGKGPLITVIAAVLCLIVGIFAGPYLSGKLSLIPNSFRDLAADQETKLKEQEARIARLIEATKNNPGTPPIDQVKELTKKLEDLNKSVADATDKQKEVTAQLTKSTGQLDQVKADLESKNEQFVKAQEAFEDLQNQTSIVQARQMGLVAEVERLTGQVGKLDEANARKRATKEALEASVERLLTEVKEGIPLTPEKFSHEKRVAEVEDLKAKVADAKWVTPELLDAYTSLYKKELEIAGSNAYFFAKIPVTNKLNQKELKWAECLMKGNWAVYYRTLDGRNVGAYENVAEAGQVPRYAFREDLPDKVQKEIQAEVVASRGPKFEQELKVIAEKQSITDGATTDFQKVFNSL